MPLNGGALQKAAKATLFLGEIAHLEATVVLEPLLLGIVLGMVVVTLTGLFVAAYRQYRRSNTLGL